MPAGGKVIHISDEMHAQLRQYCRAHNVAMRFWVESVLTREMTDPTAHVRVTRAQTSPPPVPVPELEPERAAVKKKPLPDFAEETGDEPWARPPFWAGRRGA